MRRSILVTGLVALTVACGGQNDDAAPVPLTGPTAPSVGTPPSTPPPALRLDGPITFAGLSRGSAVTGYEESGVTLQVVSGAWEVADTYGNPPPFVQFRVAGGETVSGTLQFSAGGATFSFRSVDVYASTTPIPYTIAGLRGGAEVLTLSGTVPNTFGQFRTVSGGEPVTIDTLRITLTNRAAPCCANPMGIDNLLLAK
jgi:hypothetical protein